MCNVLFLGRGEKASTKYAKLFKFASPASPDPSTRQLFEPDNDIEKLQHYLKLSDTKCEKRLPNVVHL